MPQFVHISGVDPREEVRLLDEFMHQGAAASPFSNVEALADEVKANALVVLPLEPIEQLSRICSQLSARGDGVEVVALLSSARFDEACAAYQAGAMDVLVAPVGMGAVSAVLKNLVARRERRLRQVRPLKEIERQAIAHALAATRGSVSKSARLLGIGRSTMYRKLDEYQLAVPK